MCLRPPPAPVRSQRCFFFPPCRTRARQLDYPCKPSQAKSVWVSLAQSCRPLSVLDMRPSGGMM